MEQNYSIAKKFLPLITSQSAKNPLGANELKLTNDGDLQVYYAPFDYIETKARIVVVGITPGLTQATNALQAAYAALQAGKTIPDTLAIAKRKASFSGGAIRRNLVAMLDVIGAAKYLGVQSTAQMFDPSAHDVHFTSALRYPVFKNGKNYNGTPNIAKTPILKNMVKTHLAEEAAILSTALWLPLGNHAAQAVLHLTNEGILDKRRVLTGMPHPSGANAERVAVFLGRKDPSKVSNKTNPQKLLAARQRLASQITKLEGMAR